MAHVAVSRVNPTSGKSESFMYRVPPHGPDACPGCGEGNMQPLGVSNDKRSVIMHCSKGCGHGEARERMDRVQDLWGGA